MDSLAFPPPPHTPTTHLILLLSALEPHTFHFFPFIALFALLSSLYISLDVSYLLCVPLSSLAFLGTPLPFIPLLLLSSSSFSWIFLYFIFGDGCLIGLK